MNDAPAITCYDIDGQLYEVPITELSFRPGAYAVILRDGHILAHRAGEKYDLPGGGVEIHETLEEALLREVMEETGYRVRPIDIIHVGSSFYSLPVINQHVNSISHFFHCELEGGEESDAGQDGWERGQYQGTVWLPLAEAVNLQFHHPMAVIALRKVLAAAPRSSS